jgi:hypothetical protein
LSLRYSRDCWRIGLGFSISSETPVGARADDRHTVASRLISQMAHCETREECFFWPHKCQVLLARAGLSRKDRRHDAIAKRPAALQVDRSEHHYHQRWPDCPGARPPLYSALGRDQQQTGSSDTIRAGHSSVIRHLFFRATVMCAEQVQCRADSATNFLRPDRSQSIDLAPPRVGGPARACRDGRPQDGRRRSEALQAR